MIFGRSIVVVAENQFSCDLDKEVAILDLKSGVYFGLNEVGARIWHLLQEPKIVNEVFETILEEYEVEPERCEHELVTLLQELAVHGFIEVDNGDVT
jgi:hypothetical protein